MTDEERQRQMDFILNQQARFATDIRQLEDLLTNFTVVTHGALKELNEKVTILVDAQIKTEAKVSTLAGKMTELAESRTHTDRRLDALIDIIREGRNGRS